MTQFRTFRLKIIFLCAVALVNGCASSSDKTPGHPPECELHNLVMTRMKVAKTEPIDIELMSPIDLARRQLFPHAAESHDPGAKSHDYVRAYVCPACTEARAKWLATHPK